MENAQNEKDRIIEALGKWIRQRPGLEPGNYFSGSGSREQYRRELANYRSEVRSIGKDLKEARLFLTQIRRESVTLEILKDAFKHAYSGRLSWDGKALHYCTGQYWPTEYRRAACAVMANALWNAKFASLPAHTLHHNSETGELVKRYDGLRNGDWLRAQFRREYGPGIQKRWFD